MKKLMHPVSVETNEAGDIVIGQAVGDMNEPDPEIVLTPDQAPLVASWIQQAGLEASEEVASDGAVPVRFYARGPEAEAEELSVFSNSQGMIILKIDDDTFIEVSPAMAKRLRDQLSKAIRLALTDMLRPDAEA